MNEAEEKEIERHWHDWFESPLANDLFSTMDISISFAKYYAEEQLKKMPSDEKIQKHVDTILSIVSRDKYNYDDAFIDGAKWMKQQIEKQ